MSFKNYELLSIIEYPISDYLFKEKIGTGEDLDKLLTEGTLNKISQDKYVVNQESEAIVRLDKNIDYKELHLDIIDKFYKKILNNENINSSFSIFVENIYHHINLSYHYRCLEKYNKAIKIIFNYAKKMTYWGMGDLLIDELQKYDTNKLDYTNQLWKEYYFLFSNLIKPNGKISQQKLSGLINDIANSSIDSKYILYLEAKNLEGIFYNNVLRKREKALKLFLSLRKEIENNKDKINDDVNLIYGRVLQNIIVCGTHTDKEIFALTEVIEEIFQNAEDNYELAKLYILSIQMSKKFKNSQKFYDELDKIIEILENYDFPDIERTYYNFFSEYIFEIEPDFIRYIELRNDALTSDLVLYFENFAADFLSTLDKVELILTDKTLDISNLLEGLDLLIKHLDEIGLSDERNVVRCIKSTIETKDEVEDILNQIKNNGLLGIAKIYISKINDIK